MVRQDWITPRRACAYTEEQGAASLPLFTQLPTRVEPVEKLPVTASDPRFGFKNACFGALKPDLEPLESGSAPINVAGSTFSTGSGLLGN